MLSAQHIFRKDKKGVRKNKVDLLLHWKKNNDISYLSNILRFRSNVFLQNKELVPDPASLGTMVGILVCVR